MNQQISNFNLRVYGILMLDGQVLITDEYRSGIVMTKFPGGGLEKGEGISDCLFREFKEELGIDIKHGNLFYVNDFLQVSAFNSKDQLISFYYTVNIDERAYVKVNQTVDQLKIENSQSFRWIKIADLNKDLFTLPIDQKVCELLLNQNV